MDMHYYEDFKEMLEWLNEKLIAVNVKFKIRVKGLLIDLKKGGVWNIGNKIRGDKEWASGVY